MPAPTVVVNQEPRDVQRVPFASESGLQQFVEDNAEDLLGVKVLASSRRGGAGVFKIDILAVDQGGQPWIIECKHDLVDATALRQLRRYRTALIDGWAAVASRLRMRSNVALSDIPDPVLVLVGYRFDDSFLGDQCVRLVYRYHDVDFTDDELQTQKAGRVSLHSCDGLTEPERSHPKVSKKIATTERLQRFAPALADSFWRMDAELRGLKGVKVKYGGKNFVRYSERTGVFAEAVIGDGVIRWRTTMTQPVHSASDTDTVLKVLRDRSGQAG